MGPEAFGALRGEGLCFGGLDAFGFAFLFDEVWRPGGVAEAFGFVAGGEGEELIERTGSGVHGFVGVADFGEALGHGQDGEVGWVGVGYLVPVERCGDACVGKRADGVGAGGGAVFGVLVVVEEDAVTLFLPPFGAGEGGDSPLDGACEGEGGAADFGEGPARVDADVDVHAAGAAGLGPAGEAVLLEDGFDFQGDGADVGPVDAGTGVEVDAKFVWVVEVGGPDRVRVELHAAQVDDPGQAGGVVDDELLGGAAGGEGESDCAEEGGQIGGSALLVEGLGFGAVDETLEDDWAIANALQCPWSDGEGVADEVEFGELDIAGEVEFFRMSDADGVIVDGEEFGGVVFWGGLHGHRVYLS